MKAALIPLILLASASAALAQVQPYRPINPIDMAAQARQDRERWQAGADARAAEVRAQQLQTELTVYRLRSARGPVLAPPEGPAVSGAPLPGLVAAAEQERLDASDAEQRLDAMDRWFERARARP